MVQRCSSLVIFALCVSILSTIELSGDVFFSVYGRRRPTRTRTAKRDLSERGFTAGNSGGYEHSIPLIVNSCPAGYWVDSTNKCQPCYNSGKSGPYHNCATCSAEASNNCTSCFSGYFLYPITEGHCLERCPEGYWTDISTNKCQACYHNSEAGPFYTCSTCSGGSYHDCESCPSGYFLYPSTGGNCLESCPPGYWADSSTDQCERCYNNGGTGLPYTCATCSAGASSNCTSCDSPYFLYGSECLALCPNGFWGDTSSQTCQPFNILSPLSGLLNYKVVVTGNGKVITITAGDIAQKREPGAATLTPKPSKPAADTNLNCGSINQPPCPQSKNKISIYEQFNLSISKQNDNDVCEDEPSCPPGQICRNFFIGQEYNDNGTKENGVCEVYLKQVNCAKGIPRDALAAYEVVFTGGKAIYKTTNRLVNTWKRDKKATTMYVIDGRDEKIYMVNVYGRYIQVRGSANCIDRTIPEGGSTEKCTTPRLSTHAGILMDSIARLPNKNSSLRGGFVDDRYQMRIIGAGMIDVTEGVIQWISNESGHFHPTLDNLRNTIAVLKKAGVQNFDCTYSFKVVPDAKGVYRQDKC